MSETRPPAPAGGPDNPDLERFLERVPASHRPALRTAIEQWNCAMWLAASLGTERGLAPGAELATAPVLRVYTGLIETMAGRSVAAATETPGDGSCEPAMATTSLASAVGELAGTLARLASEALAELEPRRDRPHSGPSLAHQLYDEYVECWERRYREWMLSDDFARLQGTLSNGAVALRAASSRGSGEESR